MHTAKVHRKWHPEAGNNSYLLEAAGENIWKHINTQGKQVSIGIAKEILLINWLVMFFSLAMWPWEVAISTAWIKIKQQKSSLSNNLGVTSLSENLGVVCQTLSCWYEILVILLMEEILHHQGWWLSHDLQFLFTSQVVQDFVHQQ